jgi:hypothetical protein
MQIKKLLSTALITWVSITLLILASILFIGLRWGAMGFEIFIQDGVYTHLPTTLMSVAVTWALAGLFVYMLYANKFNSDNALTWLGFYLVVLLYLNVLRERFRFGDIAYYIEAATKLSNQQPLPTSYFYMPLWATLIEFLLPLGEDGIFAVVGLLNIIALIAFYFLLQRVFEHYGFSSRLSTGITILFMLVNTPILRTLMYGQVNLHVMNAIFLSLLLYRRYPFFSALMLALAVHLKTSPLVLVLAFLLERDWRWLAWFLLGNLLLGSITLVADGISPFTDILHNLTALASQRNAIFRDNSFDSFFGFPSEVLAVSKTLVRGLVYASKGLLGIATLLVLNRLVRTQAFFSGEERGTRLFNAILPLFILMNMASPVVWVHHGIFLALSFLVLVKCLDSPAQWLWFGLAYLLEFILPTFDFYPWSYGRLLAPLICLGLMLGLSGKPSKIFETLNHWADLPFKSA